MNYKVLSIPPFDKQFKRLKKKYPSLTTKLISLIDELKVEPTKGIKIYKNCYKIRLSLNENKKGKSGGVRIITNVKIVENKVILISIYSKSATSAISEKQIDNLLKDII
ncbi:MAG: hypothetical protein Kapaf2KO_23620 [Candidatus Kapaibacteriales bacterium]